MSEITYNYVVDRIKKVMQSCKTIPQIRNAEKYCKLLIKRFLIEKYPIGCSSINKSLENFNKQLKISEELYLLINKMKR